MSLFPTPVAGIIVVEPSPPPEEGDVLLGYRILTRTDKSVFTQPKPSQMTLMGWAASAALLILCWPLTCVPCCLSCSYPDTVQIVEQQE